jgi:hypothetical protein
MPPLRKDDAPPDIQLLRGADQYRVARSVFRWHGLSLQRVPLQEEVEVTPDRGAGEPVYLLVRGLPGYRLIPKTAETWSNSRKPARTSLFALVYSIF